MRFDLADLRLFLAILDAGSITHGAAAANLSLAAASERLREMEAVGGVPLLQRGRRGVAPTRAGETLAHHARLLLRQMAAMRAELAEHAAGFRGSVRLLANSAAITEWLPARLGPFLAAHPRLDIELVERPSVEIVKAVAGGLADLGLVSDAAETRTLATRPFARDRLVVVAARDHALARFPRVALRDVLEEPLIGFDGALWILIASEAARLGHELRPRVAVRSFEGVCRLAAAGAGIGIVPEVAARRARRAMPLAVFRLTDAFATRRLLLCLRDEATLAPGARLLLDHLAEGNPG